MILLILNWVSQLCLSLSCFYLYSLIRPTVPRWYFWNKGHRRGTSEAPAISVTPVTEVCKTHTNSALSPARSLLFLCQINIEIQSPPPPIYLYLLKKPTIKKTNLLIQLIISFQHCIFFLIWASLFPPQIFWTFSLFNANFPFFLNGCINFCRFFY